MCFRLVTVLFPIFIFFFIFFFNDTATTEIYTLSLHDALPILFEQHHIPANILVSLPSLEGIKRAVAMQLGVALLPRRRSEEHTSELQSLRHLVCRLLLEKKKKIID